MGWAPIHFRRARTSISPYGQPTALITGGPFRLSRNPIYLADAMVLAGLCLAAQAPYALILLPLFIRLITTRFIRREEARLAETFPQDFAAYRRRTRRWL
ncbi:methyltransferase family protein [Paracoccus fistulariae]|uniref:Isoprenylcysteine carboxylmethyltransferase family protein n=2 Tax=Paracoccus fistulariae TaxID=658446 RepID=A0ABY7SLX9_9RHOB|nr:isoprenylcysteine carboxylmethyltransferase family protein [Paracoccus fistulariae]WCR07568.1 isoprenylcysteine carboxylmethyltransferase family protein [Paracoccus fistulariae]